MIINESNSTSNRTEYNGDNSPAPLSCISSTVGSVGLSLPILVGSMAGSDVVDIPVVVMMLSIALEEPVGFVAIIGIVDDGTIISVANEKTNH